MDIVIHGMVRGTCSIGLAMIPFMLIFGRVSQAKRDNQPSTPMKARDCVLMIIMGFAYMFASAISAQQAAWNQGLPLGIEHIILISVLLIPVWAFAALGTGTVEVTRPEREQVRERIAALCCALGGAGLAAVLSAIVLLG